MLRYLLKTRLNTRCASGQLPDKLCDYLRENRQALSRRTPIEKLRFIVLDTEATGLDVKKDRLLSIGAVAVQGDEIRIQDSFEGVIQNDGEVVRDTVHIHGILPAESSAGIPEEQMLLEFLAYMGNSILVAHNAAFDCSMIDTPLRKLWGLKILNPVLDTMDLARRFEHTGEGRDEVQAGKYSLDRLAESYEIQVHDRHTAWGDAMITARLLIVLLQKARRRGIRTLADLRRKSGIL